MFPPVNRTLCGIPLELNCNAPTDRVVMHPMVAARIEEEMVFKKGTVSILHKETQSGKE